MHFRVFSLVLSAFFHPDYTVGPGASPGLPGINGIALRSHSSRLAGFTADRELASTSDDSPSSCLTLP